jgi:hypothetical protein
MRDAITGDQYVALGALARQDPFSIFIELNALLYLGVLALVGGLGWTVQTYFTNLGDAAILAALTTLLAACLYYCVSRTSAYSPEQVPAPTLAFDYVLYLGCLVFAVELGYVEFRFQLLRANWDGYLLASAFVFFALAYRFDNRFVLSLALSSLAGWFGVRFSSFDVLHLGVREYVLAYGLLVAFAGVSITRTRIKAHFLETYLHVAANAVLAALVSGVVDGTPRWFWLLALLAASGLTVERGVLFRRFTFVLYGVIYGYIGISVQILRGVSIDALWLAYVVASGALVVLLLVVVSRRFGREE